ncbi:MAG: glycosyltransferase, partial [Actinobacteria bacterium]|nr:glycosyltransferase [Actinomycetota bacterium]
ATFTEALTLHLQEQGADVGVIRMVDRPQPHQAAVVHQWQSSNPGGASAVAHVLDDYDVAVIQHEYGIFGGADGEDVLDVVRLLTVPVITVLHTVLTDPTANQRRVLTGLCAASTGLITMTETARSRLISGWGVAPSRVIVIPHGAEDNRSDPLDNRPALGLRPTVLTWGLLGEGKGIEWALLALAQLRDITPVPLYRVVGQTHPRVLEHDGEAYRDRLVGITREFDLTSMVRFDAEYLTGPALRRIVRDADVILLPYDSRDQVTSGVLTEAVAAGKPVISTTFPHAVELLSGGAGLLVPQRDPAAIAGALRQVLTEPGLADSMAAISRDLAVSQLWPAVAERYLKLAHSVLATTSRSVA